MGGKNIVLCSDGTGNVAIKGRGTNVFKLYEAVDIQGHTYDSRLTPQVAVYGDGLGTSGDVFVKWISSSFALGLSKNIKDLYTELVRLYVPGDRIYMFGFSRGAYTVRALLGLIEYCGILDITKVDHQSLKRLVAECWVLFRREAFQRMTEIDRRTNLPKVYTSAEDRKRREKFGAIIDDVRLPDGALTIEFVGIWDTVGGINELFNWIYPMRFSELTPSSRIKRACHALSIDDDRRAFQPELWNERGRTTKVDQVWFAGMHSNVGGGYENHGMSLVALDWMMAEAEGCGLRFIETDREYVRSRKYVHDKLYNARAGLGAYYRWEPRNIAQLCRNSNVGLPKIHVSVFERIAYRTGWYAPINLPYQYKVVRTNDEWRQPPDEILRAIERLMTEVEWPASDQARNGSFLDSLGAVIKSGKMSYYTFVAASIPAVGWWYALPPYPLVADAIAQWCSYPNLIIGAIYACVGLLVWEWSKQVDQRLESAAQDYWQRRREALRTLFADSPIQPRG